MFRKLTAGVFVAAVVATFGLVTVHANKPIGIMCEFEFKGKTIVLEYLIGKKDGNMGDAVQRCLADGGHPVGVVQGK